MIDTNLIAAIHCYNKTNNSNLTLIDAFILQTLSTNSYTTDADLAAKALCSERTVKRAINKLCECGLAKKHLAYDNTKSVQLCSEAYNNLLHAKRVNNNG